MVLFSLATVVASFLKQSFPNASIWSLVAALGFGWALIFSMLVRFTRSEGTLDGFAIIYHLIIDVGVILGFASIGATLFVLSQVSGLLSAAYQFLFCEVFSLAIAPSAFRTWETSHSLRPGEVRRGTATLGWVTLVVLSLALGSPPFMLWPSDSRISGLATVIWAVSFAPLFLALAVQRLLAAERRAPVGRGSCASEDGPQPSQRASVRDPRRSRYRVSSGPSRHPRRPP